MKRSKSKSKKANYISLKELKLALTSKFWSADENWGTKDKGLSPESLISESRGCKFEVLYDKILHPKNSELCHNILYKFGRALGYKDGIDYLNNLAKLGQKVIQQKIKDKIKSLSKRGKAK